MPLPISQWLMTITSSRQEVVNFPLHWNLPTPDKHWNLTAEEAVCQAVGTVNTSLRCEFIRNTSDCSDNDGYIGYLDVAFCSFPPQLFPLAIFLYEPRSHNLENYLSLTVGPHGVTFLAFGNGAPDVFSAVAAFSDSRTAGLAIGALFGAGVFVTTVVAGSIALVKPFTAASRPFLRDIVFYMAAIFLTFYVLYRGYVSLPEVFVYLMLYLAYVLVVVFSTWIYQRMRRHLSAAPSLEQPALLTDAEDDAFPTPHGSDYGDEYQPLLPLQSTTWEIMWDGINPVDSRKWRQKRWYWKILKVFKQMFAAHKEKTLHVDQVEMEEEAHRGCIIREWLLENEVPQMERPALSPDLNPIENQWDRLVEAHKPVPQNFNDLRAALQEECDTVPQQTKIQLVNSMEM
ncbi:mitochondrial sodium/calcium exchanger protein [Anomaloglossus baeobatrachus]